MKLYRYNKEKMNYESVIVFPYLVMFCIMFLLLSISKEKPIIEQETEILLITNNTPEEEFSFKQFKQFIIDCGIRFPDIVLAQAIQESRLKSDIWKENNNPFGMKIANRRNTTSIGVNRGHAKYKNWKMAVLDYAYMQAVFARKVKTRKDYYRYLESYAEDLKYSEKLKRILFKHKGFNISDDYLLDF
jgi:hypothetical protein